jgi:hypothetical protein
MELQCKDIKKLLVENQPPNLGDEIVVYPPDPPPSDEQIQNNLMISYWNFFKCNKPSDTINFSFIKNIVIAIFKTLKGTASGSGIASLDKFLQKSEDYINIENILEKHDIIIFKEVEINYIDENGEEQTDIKPTIVNYIFSRLTDILNKCQPTFCEKGDVQISLNDDIKILEDNKENIIKSIEEVGIYIINNVPEDDLNKIMSIIISKLLDIDTNTWKSIISAIISSGATPLKSYEDACEILNIAKIDFEKLPSPYDKLKIVKYKDEIEKIKYNICPITNSAIDAAISASISGLKSINYKIVSIVAIVLMLLLLLPFILLKGKLKFIVVGIFVLLFTIILFINPMCLLRTCSSSGMDWGNGFSGRYKGKYSKFGADFILEASFDKNKGTITQLTCSNFCPRQNLIELCSDTNFNVSPIKTDVGYELQGVCVDKLKSDIKTGDGTPAIKGLYIVNNGTMPIFQIFTHTVFGAISLELSLIIPLEKIS